MHTTKILWYHSRSILTWIGNERNYGYFTFKEELLNKFRNIVKNGSQGKAYTISIAPEEAKQIIEALYVNSNYEDSSVPQDEIKFISKFL